MTEKIVTNADIRAAEEAEKERKRKEELDNEPYGPGSCELYLKAPSDKSACYRLLMMNGKERFKVFLKPGESTTKTFLSGRYTLKAAEGVKWISDDEAFGDEGDYSTTDVYYFKAGYSYSLSSSTTNGDFSDDTAAGFTQ